MKTRERILDMALSLFNEQGTGAVSTNHIAEALGISPGNLYYHFKNKEEIIRALIERLFVVWDATFAIAPDHTPTVADLERLITLNFEVLWDYRFVYRELLALLRRDAELRERYHTVRQRGFADFQMLFAAFVEAGVLIAPSTPTGITNLAELCWLISEFWLVSVEVNGKAVNQAAMQHGVVLMMQVLAPYKVAETELS